MNISKIILPLAVTMLWITPSFALEKPAMAKDLLVKSGLDQQLESMVEGTISSVPESSPNVPIETSSRIKKIFVEAYNLQTIKDSVVKGLAEDLSEADMQATLDWLNSSLGQQITALEAEASRPESVQKISDYAKQQTDIPQSRIDLIRSLDQSMQGADKVIDLVVNSTMAQASAANAMMEDSKKISPQELEKQADRLRAQIDPQMRQSVLLTFLYMYHTLSDEELQKYIHFLQSEIGTKYNSYTFKAINEAFQASSKKVGEQIVLLVNSQKKSPAGAAEKKVKSK